MELREVELDELETDPINARKHSNRNIEEIARSLREFGQHAPLVVQKGTNKIIVGNGRYEAMQMLGWDKAYIELARQLLETRNKNTTVIYENKPTKNDLHPTMKPVKLLARLIRDGSDKHALIYDPFGGSGSTLIACQQLNRTCYMMELDPKYCDVIIKRWELFTGDKAILNIKGDDNGKAGATEEAYATKSA